jgi:hypothetical protein
VSQLQIALQDYTTVTGFEPGDPAIPEIPAIPEVPPTYEDVTGGISNPDDFVWGDQGDGSNPNAAVNIPANLYTTYNGEQVAATTSTLKAHILNGVTPLRYVLGFSRQFQHYPVEIFGW